MAFSTFRRPRTQPDVPNSEDLWQQHLRRVAEDPTLDEDTKRWYSDDTDWDTAAIAAATGYSAQNILALRNGRQFADESFHPMKLPFIYRYGTGVADRRNPFHKAGVIRMWCCLRGSHTLEKRSGALIRDESWSKSFGRPRREPGIRVRG
jgi:hypothetical protein